MVNLDVRTVRAVCPHDCPDTCSMVVTVRDGALHLKPGARPARRLWPETTTAFFVKEVDAQVTFVRDADGTVTGLVIHQNGEDRAAARTR